MRGNYSEELAARVDEQLEKTLHAALDRATQLLNENREKLDRIARELINREKARQGGVRRAHARGGAAAPGRRQEPHRVHPERVRFVADRQTFRKRTLPVFAKKRTIG